jgi:type 2A phosphatase activator TIP41
VSNLSIRTMTSISIMRPPASPEPDFSSATKTHIQGHFTITSRKLPISKAGPISQMESRLSIPIPEMIFGDNLVSITHTPSNWSVSFSAEPALDLVNKTGENMLQVAHAKDWTSSRENSSAVGIKEVVRPFDWTYSTSYRGTETSGIDGVGLKESETQIPLELLKRRDPILFFDEVVLFESELDDNGISLVSVKLRVMEHRMLLLCRQFMRVDGVLVRVRDTRVYVDFVRDEVIREYTAKEDAFENVRRGLMMSGLGLDAVTVAMRDANQIAHLLPVVEHTLESVDLSA